MVNNLIAATIFFLTGWLIIILTLQGSLRMGNLEGFSKLIQASAESADRLIGNNLLLNLIFAGLVLLFLYWIAKRVRK